MRSRRTYGIARRAFTLIELLVATAVLMLLVVLIVQVLGTMSDTWQSNLRRINNFTKARAMLELIARDVQFGVFRDDLAAFPSGAMSFYTRRQGVGGSRNLTLVEYGINTSDEQSTLRRGDVALGWNESIFEDNTASFGVGQPVLRDTVAGVVGFSLMFLQKDGTYAQTYSSDETNPTRAVVVTLAVVDDPTVRRMSDAGKMGALRSELSGVLSGSRAAKAEWDIHVASGINWDSYPKGLSSGLKIFERYVPLPASQ